MIYKRKKIQRLINFGIVNVKVAKNNTILSVSDENGNVLCWSSAGVLSYNSGKKKNSFSCTICSIRCRIKGQRLSNEKNQHYY